ncbi:MAG: hypothetical protein KDC49_07950 [Saprospiraceae bacterium]|nr:hypothetical protein [Saprospiraceae bacterium]
MYHVLTVLSMLFLMVSCTSSKVLPIDKKATKETKILYYNLHKISEKHILFGHQHATEYGHGWMGDENRSDVKSVAGSHPAVIGVDFSGFSGNSPESISRYTDRLRKDVSATYDRGGIVTVAWHFPNPVTGRSYQWRNTDTITVVDKLIPGGSHHEKYKQMLQQIGDWAHSTRGSDGKLVPMIFRPYHEFDGSWFWWGRPHASREDFISLWKFTVSYLRDSLDVHQFIYAFSPDNRFWSEEAFTERYPGDAWVDMVGMDNYGDLGRDRLSVDTAALKLKIVSDFAQKHGKLAAFTETGLESIPMNDWWTNILLKALKKYPMNLSYVLVWRNDSRSPTHYYAPFPGQVSAENFIKFYEDPYTWFESDLKNIYTKKIK